MSIQPILKETEEKMEKTMHVLQQNFAGIRTGRASAGMVENLRVDYFGNPTPLKQMANITVPEPRMLIIAPWDATALKAIEKAISDSDLGLSPVIDGKMVRLVIPPLTRERRDDMVKITHKVAEEGRVSLRGVRREANEKIKVIEKEKKISTDESFKGQESVQKLTDKYIGLIDQSQAAKEKDLTQG